MIGFFMKHFPKISQLKIFESIIQYGSIRSAAKALNQTQSTVTRCLQELERKLGAALIIRGTKGIELTKIGKVFEPRMRMILQEMARAVDEVGQIVESSDNRVTFGCSYFPTFSIIPDVVKKIQRQSPGTRISLSIGQLSEKLQNLRQGKLEFYVGIISDSISLGDFVIEPLLESDFCIIARCGHPLAGSTSLSELRDAKWCLPMADAGYYSDLEAQLFPAGRGDNSSLMFSDSATVGERLVLEEDYLFIGPSLMLDLPKINQAYCEIKIQEPLPKGEYSVIYKQQSILTPMARKVVEEIRWECQKIAAAAAENRLVA
jgi:DNA-binding transcriptional LysR family regulator